MDIKDNRY